MCLFSLASWLNELQILIDIEWGEVLTERTSSWLAIVVARNGIKTFEREKAKRFSFRCIDSLHLATFLSTIHESWTRKHFCRFVENFLNLNWAENRKLTFCPSCDCSTTVIKGWQPWMEWMATCPKVTLTKSQISWVSFAFLNSHVTLCLIATVSLSPFSAEFSCLAYLSLSTIFVPSLLLLIDRWNISIFSLLSSLLLRVAAVYLTCKESRFFLKKWEKLPLLSNSLLLVCWLCPLWLTRKESQHETSLDFCSFKARWI